MFKFFQEDLTKLAEKFYMILNPDHGVLFGSKAVYRKHLTFFKLDPEYIIFQGRNRLKEVAGYPTRA